MGLCTTIVTMEMTTPMIRINKKLALVASLTVVVAGLGTGVAFAANPEPSPNDDSISPANTSFTATSTNITFSGHINGTPITVKCTNSSISAKTLSSGLGPINISPDPTFGSCGSGLHVNTNHNNGSWQLTFLDAASDEGIVIGSTTDEPAGHGTHSGDQIQITIPKAGATFTDDFIPGCTITVAPTGPVTISGTYDDVNTLTLNTSVPVSHSGCTSDPTASVSGTYSSGTTHIQDVS
jgi:hypothetical protein